MTLDATTRRANFKDSLKKFLEDNKSGLASSGIVPISYDKTMAAPSVQGTSVEKWVLVRFDHMDMDCVSEARVSVFVCTRNDNEGFKLAQLRDRFMGLLFDPDWGDGRRSIPFYASHPTDDWVIHSYMRPYVEYESREYIADDQTKYIVITLVFKWGAKA